MSRGANPRGLSFSGTAGVGGGSGLAQILPSTANPYEEYKQRVKEENQAQVAEQQAKLKADDEAKKNNREFLKITPQDFFFQNEKELATYRDGIFTQLAEMDAKGIDLSSDVEASRLKVELADLYKKSESLGRTFEKAMAYKPDDKEYFNTTQYQEDLRKQVSTTPLKDIDLQNFGETTDPRYFKSNEYIADMAENFKTNIMENSVQTGNIRASDYGGASYVTSKSGEKKMRFMKKNEQGEWVPGVSDEHATFFMQNERYKSYLDKTLENQYKTEIQEANPDATPAEIDTMLSERYASEGGKDKLIKELAKKQIETLQYKEERSESSTKNEVDYSVSGYGAGRLQRQEELLDRHTRLKDLVENKAGARQAVINSARGREVTLGGDTGVIEDIQINSIEEGGILGFARDPKQDKANIKVIMKVPEIKNGKQTGRFSRKEVILKGEGFDAYESFNEILNAGKTEKKITREQLQNLPQYQQYRQVGGTKKEEVNQGDNTSGFELKKKK